jgi:uncharacterized protein (DUF2249 family)
MKTIFIIIWISFICLYSYGQIYIGGKPYSFKNEIKAKKIVKNETQKIEIIELDFDKLKKEDVYNDSIGKPFRYGKAIQVAYDWNNSGEWIELENGDRIWKLEIYCPSAKSINLTYDKFWLPEGGLLYLYDNDKKTIIGGFNKRNNRGTKENPSKFASGLIASENIILEYYEPKEVREEGIISMSNVIYGYTDISSLLTGLCTVNINCSPEGDNWQDEKKSVALVLDLNGGGGQFTGSLINNASGDGTPYFLTCNHSIVGGGYDAISNPDASDLMFCWKYECSDCSCTSNTNYSDYVTYGATVVANNAATDFALLRLIQSPYDLSPQIQAYYNGWDRQYQHTGTVCIHHPLFQPKKISIDENQYTISGTNLWKVSWDETANGKSIVYFGSSGSPLYTISNSRVIGQLSQSSEIIDCQSQNQIALFGAFSRSWGNSTLPQRRLSDWLDPDSSNVSFLDGTYCTNTRYITNTNFDNDAVIYGCSISIQNVIVRNGADVTFNTANDAVINGEFEVVLGSSIEIK